MTVLPSYIDKPWKSWFLRKDHLLEVRIKGDRIHGLFSPILKNGLYIGVKTHLLGEMIHYDLDFRKYLRFLGGWQYYPVI